MRKMRCYSLTEDSAVIMATIGMVPGIPGTATLGATTLETTPIISHDIPTPQINATNAGYARKRGADPQSTLRRNKTNKDVNTGRRSRAVVTTRLISATTNG